MSTTDDLQTDILDAIDTLEKGGIVAFPTETVYGLGADAGNEAAIRRVFSAKGRPADHPVIVHIHALSELSRYAEDIPPAAMELAKAFWPGPLTLILPKKPDVSALITGGQDTVGLRMPNHPKTLTLLKRFGRGLIGPSANPYGRISPTHAGHVTHLMQDQVDQVLDGGACSVGIESTIVYFEDGQPKIARFGAITQSMIDDVLGRSLKPTLTTAPQPKAPGNKSSHYAPRKPVKLIESHKLALAIKEQTKRNKKVGLLSFVRPDNASCHQYQEAAANPSAYAESLYAHLHELDNSNVDVILIEIPPSTEAWLGIQDRLSRASFSTSA